MLQQKLPLVFISLLIVFVTWFVYDLLFTKPEIHEGVIVNMHFIQGRAQNTQYRLGSRIRPQMITAQSHDRWIAVVQMDNGDTTLVECKKHHFDNSAIGSLLKFREFHGGTFELKYFAHNEDE